MEKLAGSLAAMNGLGHHAMAPHPHGMGPPFPGGHHPMDAAAYGGYPGAGATGAGAGLPMRGHSGGGGSAGEGALPSRPGQEACSFYMRTGKCSYGANCRFDHPRATTRDTSGESGGSGASGAGTAAGGGSGGGGNPGGEGQGSYGQGGSGGEFSGHHYGMQVGSNGQAGYAPVPGGYGEPGPSGMYQGPGAEYGSPQGFMGYPPHPGAVQYPAQGAVYGSYRQGS